MENMLKTQLKGIVQNDSLEKLGKININVVNANHTEIRLKFDSPESPNLQNEIELSSGLTADRYSSEYLSLNGTGVLTLKDKYDLITFVASYPEYSLTDSLKTFSYCTKLTIFIINPASLVKTEFDDFNNLPDSLTIIGFSADSINTSILGDISSIQHLKNLEEILFSNMTGITGTTTQLGAYFPNLRNMHQLSNTGFSGSIEDFVRARLSLTPSQKSGTVSQLYGHNNHNLTFNGSTIPTNNPDIVWKPNTIDNTRTDITMGSITVTI